MLLAFMSSARAHFASFSEMLEHGPPLSAANRREISGGGSNDVNQQALRPYPMVKQ